MIRAVALLVPLAGCAQILGLDSTSFDQRDARVDAPSVCDGAPRCTSATGRSVCGQLLMTGDAGGQPLRVAAPTGMRCADTGSTEGPCALTIQGQPKASFTAGVSTDLVAGDVDDCGRYVVPDLDPTQADIAVIAKGGGDVLTSATLLLGRDTTAGTDTNVDLPVVTLAVNTAWSMELDPAMPPDLSSTYLVTYLGTMNAPIAGEELRLNGGAAGMPPTVPWGAYFSGAVPFGTLSPSQTTTQDSGTAVVHPPNGGFLLGGFRQGRTCTQVPLQSVPSAVVHITLHC